MLKSNRVVLLLSTILFLLSATDSNGQIFSRKNRSQKDTAAVVKADVSKKDSLKNYDVLLKDAVTDRGMFAIHRVKTDYYFEIPDSLFGRDMLIVNKISGVPFELNDAGVNKGMGTSEQAIRIYKDTLYRKVWIVKFEPRVSSPEGDAITHSVKSNYRESIVEFFPIETYGKDSTSVVVKVNKIFDGSEKSINDVFNDIGIPFSAKKDLSKIEAAKSFPNNIIVKSLLTTVVTEGGESMPLTLDVTSNIVLLTNKPMRSRFADNRVGYFTTGHLYYNDTQHKVEEREFVNRWRLEPKEEDIERYKKGELVEPRKPIVIYVDPSTPPVWVPYIRKGIEDWNDAFETAGFKGAIRAKEVDPQVETDFDIDDVRYSAVTYAASEMSNAMGPSVVDPRSGEIIEADIIWWHNVMDLLHAWIRLQTGAVDPQARGAELPTEVMGNAIRFVSAHELGHSLGLKHNFGASYSVPVDSLRSKTYTDAYGTASSIMDYARFNYIAQPEDGVVQLTPRIGAYDRHAIEWAYRWFDVESAHEELPILNAMLRQKEDDIEYWYGAQVVDNIDPRSQNEDLGNDAIKASYYGLANLKRMMPFITDWTFEEGKLHFEAGKFLNSIIAQWRAYSTHVMTNVGGVYINDVVSGRDLSRYIPVTASYQRASVKYLIDEVFDAPTWLFNDKIWETTYAVRSSPRGCEEYAPYNLVRDLQYDAYYRLLFEDRLLRMYEAEAQQGAQKTYSPEQMLAEITNAVFVKKGTKSLSLYERMSQKNFVDALIVSSNITMVKTTKKGSTLSDHSRDCEVCRLKTDAPQIEIQELIRPEELGINSYRHYTSMSRVSETTSVKRAEMNTILAIAKSRSGSGNQATRNHYKDLELRLKEALRMLPN